MGVEEKVAIVTGASSGIGRATAVALVNGGARVTITARRVERLRALAAELPPLQVCVAPADLCDENQRRGLFAESQARWERLDILVNSAGMGRCSTLHGGDVADWRRMFELNVLALSEVTREAARRFDPLIGGHVVHVSSLAAHRAPRSGSCYAATKHAVRALADALRYELRSISNRTRVSCVSPALVATEFWDNYFAGDQGRLEQLTRGCRMLSADDVATAVLFALEAPEHIEIREVVVAPRDAPD